MQEQKVLFADVYRLLGSMRVELKVIDKKAQELLYQQPDWESVSMIVNEVFAEAQIVRKMSEAVMTYVGEFLDHGPYEGEEPGTTPLEAIAK